MKKLLLLLLLFTGMVNAQIVTIPDAKFKTKLINLGVDTNTDGNIQNSEALAVTSLNVELSSISDLTGISNFTNLTAFSCGGNLLTSLNVTGLTNLIKLECQANEFLSSLDVSSLVNLEELEFTNCAITSIDISSLTNLKILKCGSNGLTSLNLSNSPGLEFLFAYNNQLTSIDLTGMNNLKFLHCSHNLFTTLNINSLTSLEELTYGNINLAAVDISNLTNLTSLGYAVGSQLPSNLENYPNLTTVSIIDTAIVNLDVSNLAHLNRFIANGNSPLTYVNLKNGNQFNQIIFVNNSNLSFVCVNEVDIQTAIDGNGIGNGSYQINSYCSFIPGGDYNTITGTATFDADANGCDASDSLIPNIKFNLNDGTNQGATFTNTSGNYKFYTETGNFEITPNVENPTFFNFSPASATINFSDDNNNITTQNFCITTNGIHPDLEIVLAPITPARPGFDATYNLVYKNKGNQTLSQSYGVNFFFNQNLMEFVSASTTPTSINPGGLSWSYTNLLPFESRSIEIILNINAPTDINPVNIDDILQFTTSILPMAGDETTSDNTFLYNQTVVGSFDPNDITCIQGEYVAPTEIGEYLHYIVNFENTGTFYAENIVVRLTVDESKYDINSMQLLNTSSPSSTQINNNLVEFVFEGINLPAATGNPPVGGHGNVLFKIRTKNSLQVNDVVYKKANIYFDYNFPIATNDAETTFAALSNGDIKIDQGITIYPNPTNGVITINSLTTLQSVALFDVQGRLMETHLLNEMTTTVDITNKAKGIYFLKITTDNGTKVEKIIKE